MSDLAIQIENLGKRYRYGVASPLSYNLREDITRWARGLIGSGKGQQQSPQSPIVTPSSSDSFWALKDINLEIKQGEVVGIIGRNGAGKSTLLKILSRITPPTNGRITYHGRMASLLEVGTGFHRELTGRENIFLNGSILGMTRAEIARKLDEIIAFAEIEKFMDTPVKFYSSGMYVRLAFAVAAHLEPEILVVDEVLAVGDAEFQGKCLGKMGDVAREGRTVLFVSHNIQAVTLLCQDAIILEKGVMVGRGPARKMVEEYLTQRTHQSARVAWPFEMAPGNDSVKLLSVTVCGPDGQVSYDQFCGVPLTVNMEFWCRQTTEAVPNFHLYNQNGIFVFVAANTHAEDKTRKRFEPGFHRCSCVIPAPLLNDGKYFLHAFISREADGFAYAHVPEAVSFQVIEDGTARGAHAGDWPGVIRPLLAWTRKRLENLPVLE